MTAHLGGTSKVTPPPAPPGLIPRPRLNTLLNEAVHGPLTLVSAGPGSGKTVLLSTWGSAAKLPTAWISLDARDDEPKRFWSLMGDALLAAGIVGDTDGFGALPHSARDTKGFLNGLLECVPGPAEHALIIDDAHHLTDPVILAELDAIVRYDFPYLRLVMSARCDPLLPLHRYRVAGQMQELRAADLAMTRPEAHALLSAHGVRLPSRELTMLNQRTEGWAAGLRLSAMSMAQSRYPAQFVTRLALDQGSVGEYLMEEVLDRQSADVRQLLVHTSFLDEITGSLAQAVTGLADSADLLAELSRTNSFVLRLDHDGDRYRCHQLLKEVLRYLLRREDPALVATLSQRAAAWYEAQGDLASAMRFAAEAGEWSQVCSVLVHGGFAKAFVERHDLGELGLGAFFDEGSTLAGTLLLDPEVRVARAAMAVAKGDLDEIEADLQAARTDHLPADAELTAGLVDVMAAHRSGSVGLLDQAATQLLDHAPMSLDANLTAGLRAAVRIEQANAHLWSDEHSRTVETFALEGLSEARSGKSEGLELELLGLLQLMHIWAGRTGRAKQCQEDAKALTRNFPRLQQMTFHHLARAYAALLAADVASAERSLKRAQQTMVVDADEPLQSAVILIRSWTMINAGLIADAYQLLQTAPELRRPMPDRLARARAVTLADIETRLGRPNAALKIIDELPAPHRDPMTAVIRARAALALGDADAAERALRPALIATEDIISLPMLIAALLTSARVADLRGDGAKAVREVLRAVDLAGGSIAQPFADNRADLEPLLTRHAEARAAWPVIEQTVALIPQQPTGPAITNRPALAQSLTDRETAVLRRLATTMTTSEIADELCISINTVKTHIAAIYRKLPAAGRRDAIVRARQLELL